MSILVEDLFEVEFQLRLAARNYASDGNHASRKELRAAARRYTELADIIERYTALGDTLEPPSKPLTPDEAARGDR